MNNWFGNLFDYMEGEAVEGQSSGGQIRMFSYIHSNWPSFPLWPAQGGGAWSDTRFTDPAIQAQFADNLENPFNGHRYLGRDDVTFAPDGSEIEVVP